MVAIVDILLMNLTKYVTAVPDSSIIIQILDNVKIALQMQIVVSILMDLYKFVDVKEDSPLMNLVMFAITVQPLNTIIQILVNVNLALNSLLAVKLMLMDS